MKHSDLKIGMKVKRVNNFNTDFYTSTKDNISTISVIHDVMFSTKEDGPLVWVAEYFEPAEESSFVEGGYTRDFGNTEIAAHVISNKEEIKEEVTMQETFDSNEQHNKITMDKKYRTRCGYPVRVLCVDRTNSSYPVVVLVDENDGDYLCTMNMFGSQFNNGEISKYDLIEVQPWEDFKKDDKVMVRDSLSEDWIKRHFAFERDGIPYTYVCGGTSWGNKDVDVVQWKYCRKPTQEELGEDQQNCFDNGE